MSFRNAIFVAIFLVSYAAGTTGTRCCYADVAGYSLARVASMRRYDLARTDPNSGCEGLRVYAFTFTGSTWDKREITWTVEKYSQWITRQCIDALMARAFQEWATWIPFEFKHVKNSKKADIRIGFVTQLPPSTLGVTSVFSQTMDHHGGDIVFSDETNWVYKDRPGYADLRHVAVHEIGHALGLDHSEHYDAIMYASHDRNLIREDFHLHDDDIAGIQKLYGTRKGGPPRRPPLPPPRGRRPSYFDDPDSPPSSPPRPRSTPSQPTIVPFGVDPDKVKVVFGPIMNEKGDFIAYVSVDGVCKPYSVDPSSGDAVPYDK